MSTEPAEQGRQDAVVEWIRDLFDADSVRLLLSTLIILSVLPFPWVERYSLVFFGVFAIELFLRVILLRAELKRRSLNRAALVVLALDFIATLSFLPLDTLVDVRWLRLVRLSRMVMLLSYWRAVVQEIWIIVLKRERRYQLTFVVSLVLILAFCSAIFLAHFPAPGIDFNEDGNLGNESFWTRFWWSFRQLQDPGNLLSDPAPTLVFVFSVVLTIAGLFVIAFFIGIGASVVEELVQVGRKRRIGVRNHSVIANLGPRAEVLVDELVRYYAKAFRTPRLATMGLAEDRPDFMYRDPLHSVPYRQGEAVSELDLARLDADRATRVILLGDRERPASDSAVVSQVLSVREFNPDCWIYPELFQHGNVGAALRAGGDHTVPILAQNFVSLLIADLIVSPGLERVYEQLLTSHGDEIYTCVFGMGHMTHVAPPSAQLPPYDRLLLTGRQRCGVTLLGYLLRDPQRPEGFVHAIAPGVISDAPAIASVEQLCGFFGVATNFEQLKDLCHQLPGLPSQQAPQEEIEQATEVVSQLASEPARGRLERIVICGYHTGLAELCGQLLLYAPTATIHVMVPDEARAETLTQTFLALPHVPDRWPGDCVVDFEQTGPGSLLCRIDGLDKLRTQGDEGRIEIIAADWSDERALRAQPERGYRLADVDAVLLTQTEGDRDPDARTALALLKLLQLCESADEDATRDALRIICAVRSSEKAELFERRFSGAHCDGDHCCQLTILAADRLQHSFVAQSVLVPGLSTIYRELLSQPGGQILELATGDAGEPEAELSYDGLLAALYRERGLVLVGVELDDDEGREAEGTSVVVNPKRGARGYRFPAGALRSVFVVGSGPRPSPASPSPV